MTYCNEQTAVKQEGENLQVITLPCRSWQCADCRPKRQKQLIAKAINGKPDMFVTLTYRANSDETPERAAARLSHAFRLFRLRYLRLHGKRSFPFIAVMEKTKKGWPHLHILARSKFISQKWISNVMDELINSPIVDIRRIDNSGRAAAYCAKYCGKANDKFDSSKRYWCSRDYAIIDENTREELKKEFGNWIYQGCSMNYWRFIVSERNLRTKSNSVHDLTIFQYYKKQNFT